MATGRRLTMSLIVVAAAIVAQPAAAQTTPVCGKPDPNTTPTKTARGTLTLDGTSKTTIAYGRDTRPETLDLLFTVSGCELDADNVQPPRLEVRPKGSPQLAPAPEASGPNPPTDVITIKNFTAETGTVEMELNVDGKAIAPDSYEAYVVLRAPYMVSTRTPIAISRSEDDWKVPAGIGALFGLLGFAWLTLTKLVSREELTIGWLWLLPFGIVGAVFGAAAVVGTWWDQEVWTSSQNGKGAAAAGIAGATTGSMLILIGAIWKAKTPSK
jgi:hypothetical protein